MYWHLKKKKKSAYINLEIVQHVQRLLMKVDQDGKKMEFSLGKTSGAGAE